MSDFKFRNKVINDPVFGLITIPHPFLDTLIQNPIFQRLHRIRQLGLASFVYPGAQHTRFHHSIGAMYLMSEALQVLKAKGNEITEEEELGTLAAILLHDVGHAPFSHVLECTLTEGVHHEKFSLGFMHLLNEEYKGKLDICIQIFTNTYHKKFLHQLVSGQLDVDRLDYLRRDSYFTGVSEGTIGSLRIIKMLDVKDDSLVVEGKGIYSIENFLLSRRLMYWQVYFHKTSVAAKHMLIKIFQRAKHVINNGGDLFSTPAFKFFLSNTVDSAFFETHAVSVLNNMIMLDDNDIWSSLKVWSQHPDKILSYLSSAFVSRHLFKIKFIEKESISKEIETYVQEVKKNLNLTGEEIEYLYDSDVLNTKMYNAKDDSIRIISKTGEVKDISESSDILSFDLLSKEVEKYFFTYYPIKQLL